MRKSVSLHFLCAVTSKLLNRLIWNLNKKLFFMMPRCILSILFVELLIKRCTNWTLFIIATTPQQFNQLSWNNRWCKVLILLSLIYHYIISIYKAIWYQWLFCLFVFCSLTPPKQQTPTRLNFERWFPLGCRGFQAKKHSDSLNHW